jgi:hypothetical protein
MVHMILIEMRLRPGRSTGLDHDITRALFSITNMNIATFVERLLSSAGCDNCGLKHDCKRLSSILSWGVAASLVRSRSRLRNTQACHLSLENQETAILTYESNKYITLDVRPHEFGVAVCGRASSLRPDQPVHEYSRK